MKPREVEGRNLLFRFLPPVDFTKKEDKDDRWVRRLTEFIKTLPAGQK
jgi:hypothetical protein